MADIVSGHSPIHDPFIPHPAGSAKRQRGAAVTSLLKSAATGLALGVLTLGATASAQAADPEGRFRISAEMDGYPTIHIHPPFIPDRAGSPKRDRGAP